MQSKHPLLKVKKTNDKEYVVEIEKLEIDFSKDVCITIGREESNHIVLSDPQKNISRKHCSLHCKDGRWWIDDRQTISGNNVAWETNDGNDTEILIYNVENNSIFQATDNEQFDNYPSISANGIAWFRSSDDSTLDTNRGNPGNIVFFDGNSETIVSDSEETN